MGVRVEKLELIQVCHKLLLIPLENCVSHCLRCMQVQLPFLRVNKEGKICFAAAEQIKTVLKYLTDLCQVNYQ